MKRIKFLFLVVSLLLTFPLSTVSAIESPEPSQKGTQIVLTPTNLSTFQPNFFTYNIENYQSDTVNFPGWVYKAKVVLEILAAVTTILVNLSSMDPIVYGPELETYILNNYNTLDYTIIRMVWDDGCWSPDFPNNPFCYYDEY